MSAPGIPSNFLVQTANQQILVSWSKTAGADSYVVQRSLDNITFSTVATVSGTPLATQYLDTAVSLNTQYWYKTAALNGVDSSPYTTPASAIPAPTGEMTLSQIRLAAQQRVDRVNSQFVTQDEWRGYINKSMFELYDLLVTVFEDYFVNTPISFVANGSTFLYPLPNGSNTFTDALTGQTITPKPFYKLLGLDLALNSAPNGFVTINKFNFIDRNRFVYPNTASTIYGVFNMQYRTMGSNIQFIPTPSGNQTIRMWYIPRLLELLQETDTTDISISGWIEYVIVRAAKYALDKEESDSSQLTQEIIFLKTRIEESAANRDAGIPDKISDTNQGNWSNGWRGSSNGSIGGFQVIPLAPIAMTNNLANHDLTHAIFSTQNLLGYFLLAIQCAYFLYLFNSKFRSWILNSFIGNFFSHSASTFKSHVSKIVGLRSKEQMTWVNTTWVVTSMANAKVICNLVFKKTIRYSRGKEPFTFYRKPSSNFVMTKRASPQPTSFSNIDFRHKPSFCIHNGKLTYVRQAVK